ncbi:MAG: hypothetical protein M3Q70_02840 [bacterium]|nr:hypothetical protein [bacterium]
MDMPLSERRQIENEMIFRRVNEKVGEEIDDLNALHIDEDNPELIWDDTLLLDFRCECSDEKCHQRIAVKLSDYKKIHENRNAFIVKKDHDIEAIEKIILSEDSYNVVLKNNSTSEPSDDLNKTTINNS